MFQMGEPCLPASFMLVVEAPPMAAVNSFTTDEASSRSKSPDLIHNHKQTPAVGAAVALGRFGKEAQEGQAKARGLIQLGRRKTNMARVGTGANLYSLFGRD